MDACCWASLHLTEAQVCAPAGGHQHWNRMLSKKPPWSSREGQVAAPAVFASVLITHPRRCTLADGADYQTPAVLHAWVWSTWAVIAITVFIMVRGISSPSAPASNALYCQTADLHQARHTVRPHLCCKAMGVLYRHGITSRTLHCHFCKL